MYIIEIKLISFMKKYSIRRIYSELFGK